MSASELIALLSSFLGFVLLVVRLYPFLRKPASEQKASHAHTVNQGRVSIIIPARNEESNLPGLLNSVLALQWSDLEIVIVDDESTDGTYQCAEDAARLGQEMHPGWIWILLRGKPRPENWTGKNWACHQGYLASTGKWILFTDADTWHEPNSLQHAIDKMHNSKGGFLDLYTAVPFHRCVQLWEKLLGPFHAFMLVSTAAFAKPKIGRVFAIGQYLLFRRESYILQGGHERIQSTLADDIELAHECLKRNGRYEVEASARIFRVRMYDSFSGFLKGWRRIFRLGFRHARLTSVIEMYFVIAALTCNMQIFTKPVLPITLIALMVASAGVLAVAQKRLGEFSIWGIFALPFGLGVFVFVSFLALVDLVSKKKYAWRDRQYHPTAQS